MGTTRKTNFRGAKTAKEHREIASRGGQAKVKKGLAALSPERRKEISLMGVAKRAKKMEENEAGMDKMEEGLAGEEPA